MATVNGTAGPDVIHQAGDGAPIPPGYTDVTGVTESFDSIEAGEGDDIVYGRGGGDVIFGGLGADTLFGGAGFDSFRIRDLAELAPGEAIDGGGEGTEGGSLDFLSSGGVIDLSLNTLTNVNRFLVTTTAQGRFDFLVSASQFVDLTALRGRSGDAIETITVLDALIFDGALDMSNIDEIQLSGTDDILVFSGFLEQGEASRPFRFFANEGNDVVDIANLSFFAPSQTIWIEGGVGRDRLSLQNGMGIFLGGKGRDTLVGGRHDDDLRGGGAADIISGGASADLLTGGAGSDTFIVVRTKHSQAAAGRFDIIRDFSQLEEDLVDLSRIDADDTKAGNQAFTLGGAVFSGLAGELIQTESDDDIYLLGDTDGDGAAEFQIYLLSLSTIATDGT